jgi:hypothetical protein
VTEIRKFRRDEAGLLAGFIGAHWQSGHVLSTHQALLDWQHLDEHDYAYLGAWEDGGPLAILGYIPTRRYDSALATDTDNVLWLALWKLRDDVRVAGLGLRLLSELARAEPNVAVGVVGINAAHLPMYRALRFEVGELQQFVMFRRGVKPALAAWPDDSPLPTSGGGRASLREVDALALATIDSQLALGDRATQLPRKTGHYFKTRYLQHPFYRYRVHAIELDGVPRGLIASRLCTHEGHSALRLVDWYGDAAVLAEAGAAFGRMLEETGAEYADLWQSGIASQRLAQAGFAAVDPEGRAIVPTLFEPFLRQNRRLQFAFRARSARPFVIMRADGDQDRPSQLGLAA